MLFGTVTNHRKIFAAQCSLTRSSNMREYLSSHGIIDARSDSPSSAPIGRLIA